MLDPQVRAVLEGKADAPSFIELDPNLLAAMEKVSAQNLSPADRLLLELSGTVE